MTLNSVQAFLARFRMAGDEGLRPEELEPNIGVRSDSCNPDSSQMVTCFHPKWSHIFYCS